MALGFAGSVADAVLDALCRAGTFTGPATLFLQLHVGDPGSAGINSVATNSARKAVAFTVSSSGTNVSSADVGWTNVPGAETYTHFSIWDASSAGNFQFSGTMSAPAVLVGYNFTIPAGSELSTLSVAA